MDAKFLYPKEDKGYRAVPFSVNRRMVAASASVGRQQDNIHTLTEVTFRSRDATAQRIEEGSK